MDDPASVVEKLRPLHAPAADGMAEILVMALAGCLAAAGIATALHFLARRRPLRRAALTALAASRVLTAPERLAAQARMLRHVAGALDRSAASLHGDEWLARLDAIFATRLFTEGAGRAFGDALYRPLEDDPAAMLDGELARLLARLEQ